MRRWAESDGGRGQNEPEPNRLTELEAKRQNKTNGLLFHRKTVEDDAVEVRGQRAGGREEVNMRSHADALDWSPAVRAELRGLNS